MHFMSFYNCSYHGDDECNVSVLLISLALLKGMLASHGASPETSLKPSARQQNLVRLVTRVVQTSGEMRRYSIDNIQGVGDLPDGYCWASPKLPPVHQRPPLRQMFWCILSTPSASPLFRPIRNVKSPRCGTVHFALSSTLLLLISAGHWILILPPPTAPELAAAVVLHLPRLEPMVHE